jgi:hypothetical protein
MRIETIPGASAARLTDEQAGAIDVMWYGFRPLASLEGLSGPERAAVHRQNVERRKLDLADYQRFLGRFVEEGRGCLTFEEHVAHGRPKVPEPPWEPGGTRRDNEDLRPLRQGFVGATRDALLENDRARAKLEKRRMPLDVQVEASVAVKARVAGREIGVEKSLTDGSDTGLVGLGLMTEKCKLDEGGKCVTKLGGAAIANGGLESVEISTGATYMRASCDAVAGGLKAGRTIDLGALALRAEAKLGVNVQLLDAETVRRALSNEDFWTKKR